MDERRSPALRLPHVSRRKVRCDSKEGVCERCRRLNLECARLNGSSLSAKARVEMSLTAKSVPGLNQAGFKRIRVTPSCLNCRRKKKCTGDRPNCARCAQEGRECVYSESSEIGCGTKQHSPTSVPFDRSLVFALVENFFEEIAPLRCFGFLHEPTFMQQLEMGSDEKDPLLYSVCI